MAAGQNQKLKLLYLSKIFHEQTDENHGLTMSEIISTLNAYEVNADRKTLYLDFEELRHFGLDIISEQSGKSVVYRLASRDFELPELKLLVDSVQSSKFITEKKSRELIKKLEALSSHYEAKELHRNVIIAGRVKTINEAIYYNVDKIHAAKGMDKQISFQYFQWTVDKKMELRHEGAIYTVSPWHLVWDDENYYMVAYDSVANKIKHYRVDKMLHIEISTKEREGKDALKELDVAAYSKQLFGMLSGDASRVTLECENSKAGIIIDRFGSDCMLMKKDADHFSVSVEVVPSDQFIGWIIGLGKGIKIIAPDEVVLKVKNIVNNLIETY